MLKKFETRDLIYAFVLVVGFGLVVSGLNGILEWGLSDMVSSSIGAVLGIGVAFWLSRWRKR